jgi:hypothetical protein
LIPAKLTANVELAGNTNIASSVQELNIGEPKLPYNITGGLHASRRKVSSMELKYESKVGPRVNKLRVLITKRYGAQIEGKALQDLRIQCSGERPHFSSPHKSPRYSAHNVS